MPIACLVIICLSGCLYLSLSLSALDTWFLLSLSRSLFLSISLFLYPCLFLSLSLSVTVYLSSLLSSCPVCQSKPVSLSVSRQRRSQVSLAGGGLTEFRGIPFTFFPGGAEPPPPSPPVATGLSVAHSVSQSEVAVMSRTLYRGGVRAIPTSYSLGSNTGNLSSVSALKWNL